MKRREGGPIPARHPDAGYRRRLSTRKDRYPMNNLVLCGFMGCGKTTVGRLLAARTGRRFVDTDALIEEEAGMAVEDIFKRFGEEDFR